MHFKIKLGFFEKNSHYGDPSSSRTFINKREYHCAKVSFLNKVIFELLQFLKKSDFLLRKFQQERVKVVENFQGQFFPLLIQKGETYRTQGAVYL